MASERVMPHASETGISDAHPAGCCCICFPCRPFCIWACRKACNHKGGLLKCLLALQRTEYLAASCRICFIQAGADDAAARNRAWRDIPPLLAGLFGASRVGPVLENHSTGGTIGSDQAMSKQITLEPGAMQSWREAIVGLLEFLLISIGSFSSFSQSLLRRSEAACRGSVNVSAIARVEHSAVRFGARTCQRAAPVTGCCSRDRISFLRRVLCKEIRRLSGHLLSRFLLL